MPFIVSTSRVADKPTHDGPAVATLKQARQDARNLVEDRAQAPGWTPEWIAAREQVRALTEQGGTIGPLPDGYVINVQAVSPLRLASLSGLTGEEIMACKDDRGEWDFQPIIDAYNAMRQGSR